MRTLRVDLRSPVTAVDDAALAHHHRTAIIPGIGAEGIARLAAARILVVGAGGLGSPVLSYLTAAGIGTIGICDEDVVEDTNLQRQIIHGVSDVGVAKTESAVAAMRRLNPDVTIHTYGWVTEELLDQIGESYDIVVDCGDNFDVSYLLGDWSAHHNVPYVWGAIVSMSWQVSVFWAEPNDGKPGATMRDLYPTQPEAGSTPSSHEIGVLGAVVGEAGSTMATEIIKLITGIGVPLIGRVAITDSRVAKRDTVTFLPAAVGES